MTNAVTSRNGTVGVAHKTCRDCRAAFPLTAEFFNRRSVHLDGWNTLCKQCERARANAYFAANRERICARVRERRDEAVRETERRYWEERRGRKREKVRADARAKYLRNPEKYKQQLREWAAAHPAYISEHARKKNFRRRGAPMDGDAIAYVQVLRRDPCAYCGATDSTPEIDHIIPISAGGTSECQNLTAACRQCNAAKLHKPLFRFLAETWSRS